MQSLLFVGNLSKNKLTVFWQPKVAIQVCLCCANQRWFTVPCDPTNKCGIPVIVNNCKKDGIKLNDMHWRSETSDLSLTLSWKWHLDLMYTKLGFAKDWWSSRYQVGHLVNQAQIVPSSKSPANTVFDLWTIGQAVWLTNHWLQRKTLLSSYDAAVLMVVLIIREKRQTTCMKIPMRQIVRYILTLLSLIPTVNGDHFTFFTLVSLVQSLFPFQLFFAFQTLVSRGIP